MSLGCVRGSWTYARSMRTAARTCSAPGLVKDANGVLRVHVVSFPGQ